jgi:hypothetical protein
MKAKVKVKMKVKLGAGIKMKKINIKQNKNLMFLYATVLILALLYLLSFVKKTDKRKAVNTALINSKYQDSIYKLQLSNAQGSLEITKKDGIWFAGDFPADSERINNFLKNLTKIRTLYKLQELKSNKASQSESLNEIYGFDEANKFVLRYFYNESDFMDLIFGKNDFSQTSRYLMTSKSTAIFEVDNLLEPYLTLSRQIWCEPYMISHIIPGKIDSDMIMKIKINYDNNEIIKDSQSENWKTNCSKLLDLRHGGFQELNKNGNTETSTDSTFEKNQAEMILSLELGNKNSIKITISPDDNSSENIGQYQVQAQYYLNASNQIFTCNSQISLWTYNKIKEIML